MKFSKELVMSNKSIPALVNGGWRKLPFEYFRQGIEVHWLIKGGAAEPSVAFLKYEPGSAVPRHRHAGLETIVVLDGVQSDESGDYAVGTVVLNELGSEHSVWSKDGCVVLIQWNLPVIILGDKK
jgi:anti-sigma factor ChrR (cupin superfamily)